MVATLDGRRAVLTGGDDGSVRARDPLTGTQVGASFRPEGAMGGRTLAAAVVNDRLVMISGAWDGRLAISDLAGPRPPSDGGAPNEPEVADAWWKDRGYPSRTAITELSGRRVAVVGFSDGAVRVFDLHDGADVSGPFAGHAETVMGVGVVSIGGRLLVASGRDELVQHDLASGEPVGSPLSLDVHALATATVDGRPMLIVGQSSGILMRVDTATLAPLGEPMGGHTDRVWMIATTEVEGQPVALSAGGETVNLWELRTGRALCRELVRHPGGAYAVAVGELNGRPVAFTAGRSGLVWRVDLVEAVRQRPSARTVLDAGETVTALAVTTIGGRAWLVVGTSYRAKDGTGSAILWCDPDDGSVRQKLPLIGVVEGLTGSGDTLVIAAEEGLLAYAAVPSAVEFHW